MLKQSVSVSCLLTYLLLIIIDWLLIINWSYNFVLGLGLNIMVLFQSLLFTTWDQTEKQQKKLKENR